MEYGVSCILNKKVRIYYQFSDNIHAPGNNR